MAKIKKSIWSMALGVVLCLSLVVGVVVGTTSFRSTSAATSENAQKYAQLMTSFGNTPNTSILAQPEQVKTYFEAQKLYDEQLDDNDKQDILVVAAKTRFDQMWTEIFEGPHSVIDRINSDEGPIVEQGEAHYSDVATVNSIKQAYDALDPYQQAYVGTLAGYDKKATAEGYVDALMAKINAVLDRMDKELGEIVKDEHVMALADDATYKDVMEDFNALDPTAQEYVKTQDQYKNNVDQAKAKIDEFMKKLQEIADIITNDFADMLNRNDDNGQGVIYSDHEKYDELFDLAPEPGRYEALESDEKEWVRENSTWSNKGAVDTALKAIQEHMQRVITAIDEELGGMLSSGVRLSNEERFNAIEADYKSLDKSAQAHVQEVCGTFGNIEKVRKAIADRKALLDQLVKDINEQLYVLLPDNVRLSNEETYNSLKARYDAMSDDAVEKEYVDSRLSSRTVLTDVAQKIQERKTTLDALAGRIDNELGPMLPDQVKLSDEETITDIANQYAAVTDPTEKQYVDDKCTEKNIPDAQAALAALKARLDEIVSDINDDLGEIVGRDVKLSDESTITRVDEEYTALNEEEQAYVDAKANEEYIEQAKQALAALKAKLDGIVSDIDDELGGMLERGVKLTDESRINAVDQEYSALTDEEKAYVDERATEKNIPDAKEALAKLKGDLDALVQAIQDLGDMVDRGVKLSDEETINSIDSQYTELGTEDKQYVNDRADEENIQSAKDALEARRQELTQLANDINTDLNGKLTTDSVKLADETRYNELKAQYDAVTDPVEKAFVDNLLQEKEVFPKFQAALDALKEKLQEVIDGINDTLGGMLDRGVQLSDEPEFNKVDEAYKALETDEKEYVDANAEEENIEAVRDALQGIKDSLQGVIDEITDELEGMLTKGVELSDEERYNEIVDDYNKLDREDKKQYVQENSDFSNIQEVADELAKLKQALDQKAEELNQKIHDLLDDGVTWSDKTGYDEIEKEISELSPEEQAYLDTKLDKEAKDSLKNQLDALKAEMDRIGQEMNGLGDILNRGVFYSDKETYDRIKDAFEALDGPGKLYVSTTYQEGFANYSQLNRALTEIENRANAVKTAISNIQYRYEETMTNNPAGDIVYDSQTSVDAVTEALDRVYNGDASYKIGDLDYNWNAKEISALAGLIDNLGEYDAAVATLNAYRETALAVANDYKALNFTTENHYKAQEDAFNTIYDRYEALDLGLFNNTKQYIESATRTSIENLHTLLGQFNEWILKVAQLVDADATTETADDVVTAALAAGLDQYNTFNVTTVDNLLNEYTTLIVGDDNDIRVASLADPYSLLTKVKQRIEELNDQLAKDIKDLVEKDKKGQLTEEDLEKMQDILDKYEDLDDTQKQKLEESLKPETSWEEFEALAEKYMFYLYFKSAVEELDRQVQDGYFTVEGLVQEKTLLAMYCNFDEARQSVVKNQYEKLLAIDKAYETADLLDYNKVKDELENADEALKSELEEAYKNADEALKSELEEALKNADDSLKAEIENAYGQADQAIKEALEQEYNAKLDELQKNLDDLNNDLQGQIDELKKAVEEASKANDKVDSLKKALTTCAIIGAIAIVALAVCVALLFVRGKKASGSNKKEQPAESSNDQASEQKND